VNIVFMGTAPLACASLDALCAMPRHKVVGVFTQPDRPAGRDRKLTPSPVKKAALARGLPIFQPEKLNAAEAMSALRALHPDLIVVVAYGQILHKKLLELPPLGCINVHASLLPRWRGAAPIPWAILSGDAETGVTTMRMEEGLDTGPILLQKRTLIYPDDTSASLHERLANMGAELMVETIEKLERGELKPTAQDPALATYARKLTKEDGRINWGESQQQICRKVRAFDPWPGAFCFWTDVGCEGDKTPPRLIKIWRAEPAGPPAPQLIEGGVVLQADRDGILVAAGDGAVRITQLQLEGHKRMSAADFLRGHKLRIGRARF
jgi:methionyl-tRNA formyltransferase